MTAEPVGDLLAGPAIRAVELARAAQLHGHRAEVVTTSPTAGGAHGVPVRHVPASRLHELATSHDVVVVGGDLLARSPRLATGSARLVVDLYDPFHLEQLEQARHLPAERYEAVVRSCVEVLNFQLARGDYFLCASERQRDLWLGHLSALGRVGSTTYAHDPSLRRLVDVVAFGTATGPAPVPDVAGLQDVLGPEAAGVDEVVVWGGGMYEWLDPETVVRAVPQLLRRHPRAVVLFLGGTHPNADVPAMPAAARARAVAQELGLLGRHVVMHAGWVPYDRRGPVLAACRAGVIAHPDHVETRFSFRTRLLDYVWAGLPVVSTSGDVLSGQLAVAGCATLVPPADPGALAAALAKALTDPPSREHVLAVAAGMTWPTVAAPLLAYLDAPWRAADLSDPAAARRLAAGPPRLVRPGVPARVVARVRRAAARVRPTAGRAGPQGPAPGAETHA